jgi:hypothetical protein
MKAPRQILFAGITLACSVVVASFARADDSADAIIRSVADSLKPPRSFSALSKIDT